MTLQDLIGLYRAESNDKAPPYFFDDLAITSWLNAAQKEAVLRGRLIHESSNAAVTNIAVTANQTVCPLHPTLYEIDYIAFLETGSDTPTPLYLISREDLDAVDCDWRSLTGTPEYAIQSDQSLRLCPKPEVGGTLLLEGFRFPLVDMAIPTDIPEINTAHHSHLVDWALHKAYSVPDTEFFDKDRASISLKAFSDYFGLRPDSDLRRKTREDVVHHVEAFFV